MSIHDAQVMEGVAKRKFNIKTTVFAPAPMARGKARMLQYLSEEKYRALVKSGDLLLQPSLLDLRRVQPRAVLVNLFHEGACYLHRSRDTMLYRQNRFKPPLERTLETEYLPIDLAEPYMERFAGFVLQLRQTLPGVPILVLGRALTFPYYGDNIGFYSYLEEWNTLQNSAQALYGWLTENVTGLTILDVNRVLCGFATLGMQTSELFPCLLPGWDADGNILGVLDIEHFAPEVYERLAEITLHFAATGHVEYLPHEVVPQAFFQPGKHTPLDADGMEKALESNDLYRTRTAIVSAILRLPQDHLDLFRQQARTMYVGPYEASFLLQYVEQRGLTVEEGAALAGALWDNIAARYTPDSAEYAECTSSISKILSFSQTASPMPPDAALHKDSAAV